MKVAILIDTLVNKGGSERLVLAQAQHYNADIYAGKYNPDTTFEELKKCKITTLLPNRPHSSLDTIKVWLAFRKLKLDYDVYLLQGVGSLNAAKNCKPNVWYCNSPSRYLYDLYPDELKKRKGASRLFYQFITSVMRFVDQRNVKQVDSIISNSNNISGRVFHYYNRVVDDVIYPFVDLDKFKFIKHSDFFLSTGRLDSIKRIDLIVKAFQKIPNKKLVVISSGPDEQKIKDMCKGYKNISLKGMISEERLYE